MTDAIDLIDARLAELATVELEIKKLKDQRKVLVAAEKTPPAIDHVATARPFGQPPEHLIARERAIANESKPLRMPAQKPKVPTADRKPRRAGLKDDVVDFLSDKSYAAKTAQIAVALNAEVGSISMALTRLKKDGVVTNEGGYWKLAKAPGNSERDVADLTEYAYEIDPQVYTVKFKEYTEDTSINEATDAGFVEG